MLAIKVIMCVVIYLTLFGCAVRIGGINKID